MAQLDSELIKKAHAKTRYTAEMAEELRKCTDPISGPLFFMENFIFPVAEPPSGY